MKKTVLSIIASCACLLFLALDSVSGAEQTVKSGSWELSFDESNGYWKTLKWKGQIVSENPEGIPPFNWGPEWAGGKYLFPDLFLNSADWIPDWPAAKGIAKYVLKSHTWNEKEAVLILEFRINDWNVKERIGFGLKGDPDLISRTLELVYAPENKTEEPAVFANVVFNTPIAKKGRYFFPGKRNPALNKEPKDISSLPKKFREESHWCVILTMLLEQDGNRTAIFLPDPLEDLTNMQILFDGKFACVQSNFKSYGWAYPGEAQTIGPSYMKMTQENIETAFKGGVWKLYDETGLKIPEKRPEWFRDMALYSFHPGGSADSNWKDLGGFNAAREEMIPRLQSLGFNSIWVLPVEELSVYHPRDYYKIDPKLGTAADYRALTDAAHANKIRVLQDIVVHGGRPEWGVLRGNKPWQLTFDKNGNALNYWCFDYSNPEWQQYMAAVAEYYMKNFALDGFRMDVPDGSHIPNWRKKDFPSLAVTPKNVPEDWWKSELLKNGGKMPPIPFERASVTRRQGGLQMIHGVREAVKKVNPDGGVLGEVTVMPYSNEADLLYDMELCYFFFRDLILKASPEEFTQGLSRRLEQQKYAELKDSLKMRYTESHDSFHIRPYLGVNASMAAIALTIFMDGVPMIYQDADIGIGVFLKKALEIRKELPEIRRGDAYYQAVKASSASVLTCLRTFEGNSSLLLVSFSPEKTDLSLEIPAEFLPDGEISAWDCRTGKLLTSGKAASLNKLNIKLAPWDYAVIAFRPSGQECPVKSEKLEQVPSPAGQKIEMTKNKWGSIIINGASYSLRVSKSDGISMSLPGDSEDTILTGPVFIYDSLLDQDTVKLPAAMEPVAEKTSYGFKVETSVNLPVGGTARITYRCMPESVEADAVLEGSPEARRIGIAFTSKNIKRWQVNTAEGLLDDYYSPRHVYGTPFQSWGRAYRMQGTPVIWQARTGVLDVEDARICALRENGTGISIAVKNPLNPGLENAMVLDKLNKDLNWYAAFMWRDREARSQSIQCKEEFTLILKPAFNALSPKENAAEFKLGELTVRNTSLGWSVKNPYFTAEIPRMGGFIKSLSSKEGKQVLSGAFIYADNGFAPKEKDTSFAAQSNDIEAGLKIWTEDNKLKMLFSGMLKGAKTASHEALPLPPLRFTMLYTFDGKSPSFDIKWGILCEGSPKYGNPSFGFVLQPESALKAVMRSADGKELSSAVLASKERQKEIAGTAVPDSVSLLGKDSVKILEFSKISKEGKGGIFVKAGKLYIADFDGSPSEVEPGKWYTSSMTVTLPTNK